MQSVEDKFIFFADEVMIETKRQRSRGHPLDQQEEKNATRMIRGEGIGSAKIEWTRSRPLIISFAFRRM